MAAHVIGRIARLRPGAEREYRRLHRDDWVGIRDLYRAAGFRGFRIFHHTPENFLVSVVEHGGPDPEAAFRSLWSDPRIERWRAICAAHQEPLASTSGAIWAPMDIVLSDDLSR